MSKFLPKEFQPNKLALLIAATLSLSSVAVSAQENAEQGANQTAAQSEDDGIERIYVTATKRKKSLQETPVAVTVIRGEDIARAKIQDMNDLQTLVPSLRVTPLQYAANTGFSLRGFSNGTNNTGIEPAVGVFIDGVYRSRAAAQISDLPRLQQIEVLSGPQSTLFGKNASAGVINVRTAAPSHDLEGKVDIGVGNYNKKQISAYITNGITDELAFSLSGSVDTRDGYTKSVMPDIQDLNDRDRWSIRGQALYEPNEDVKIRFIADYNEIDEQCCTFADVINGPSTNVIQLLGGTELEANPFAYQAAANVDSDNTVEDGGFSLHVDIDYANFAFTSITALRSNDSAYESDIDYTSLDILNNKNKTEIETLTQEFRLTSTGTNTLDWMVGVFLFSEEVEQDQILTFGTQMRDFFDVLTGGALAGVEGALIDLNPGDIFAAGQLTSERFVQENDAYSLFANIDYHISDDLTATFGVSHTNDEKEVTISQPEYTNVWATIDLNTAPTNIPGLPLGTPFGLLQTPEAIAGLQGLQFVAPIVALPNGAESNETSDSKTTWTARLAYKYSNNINFFATTATGFKASSWNLSRDSRPFDTDAAAIVSAGLAQPNQTYGTRFASPEEATVYELGMKARFQQGAFNITLFDQTIEGFQSSIFNGTGFVLANAGEQTTKGIEFDSVYSPNDEWTFSLAGIFLDPIYDSFEGATGIDNVAIDLSGEKPAGIHERSITAGITYNFELNNGMYGYVRTDYMYESEARLVHNVPASLTREVGTLNLSAGLNLDNGVKLQVWARNLNNDEYLLSAAPVPIQSGYNAYPNQPRTFGANISYEF